MSAHGTTNAAQQPMEPDSFNSSDQDSAYDADSISGSLTSSLTESIYNYRKLYGRTYHAFKDRQYEYPNDEPELDRLDLQHHLYYKRLDGKLFLAPISDAPQNVLDVGTGTGIWAIEFAETYPTASVTGTDLSPTQPQWVPPNVQFEVDDSNETWTFARKFDFIHCRQLHMALDEKRLFKQSLDALKPGGWLEIKEVALPLICNDDTLDGTCLTKWTEEIMKAANMIDTPLDKPWHYQQWMQEAGFVNVKELVYPLPINQWPKDRKLKDLGMWEMTNLLEGIEGFSMALFTKVLGWSRAELEVFLADVRKDVQNRKIHAYWRLVAVIGQKPPQKQ
jgi:SAM-dependent methyltransferase